jgi:hypothetical protein
MDGQFDEGAAEDDRVREDGDVDDEIHRLDEQLRRLFKYTICQIFQNRPIL